MTNKDKLLADFVTAALAPRQRKNPTSPGRGKLKEDPC
jgi:hypothetical protein